MTTELELNWTLGTPGLLMLAVAAVALLLVLIIRFRVHAFLALVLTSLLTAVASGIPAESVITTLTSGFGSTLASVALLVGLGAMLGRMLETSGGADVMTSWLISKFGGSAPRWHCQWPRCSLASRSSSMPAWLSCCRSSSPSPADWVEFPAAVRNPVSHRVLGHARLRTTASGPRGSLRFA